MFGSLIGVSEKWALGISVDGTATREGPHEQAKRGLDQ